jgi:predicted unusual protein kinase regulating ubiquinone biosynthesis (AarF/ABC1/UbiB family)
MFKFRHLSHYKSLWKLCRVKQSSLRSSFSLFSISVVGGFYHHDSYADASFLREDQTNTFVVQSKVDHKSDLRKLEAKVNSLFRLVRWLEESISHLATLFFRSIYLLMAFSPATTTFPLLLIGSDEIEKWWWNILRDCVRRSGPCSTKFAQWIATRPDLFPLSLCKNLEDLQSKAFQHKWKDTEKALVLAFGEKWADLIHLEQNQTINGAPFSPVVLGSGCVAQVLLGKLGDRRVAVKIIHPGDHCIFLLMILYLVSSIIEKSNKNLRCRGYY